MADSSPRHDNNASTTAMDKLQAIDQQRAAVERRLVQRLQRQLQQLRALLCAAKWRLTTLRRRRPEAYTQDLVDDATKKLRMEVGAFEYAAKEQSELLTRALFQLDDILSNGDDAVKSARKALVLSVQQLLERADAVKAKAALLKQFAERLLEHLPVVPEAQDEDMEETAEPQTKVAVEQDDENDWEHVEAEDVRPLFASDDEAEEAEPMEQESAEAAVEDAVMLQPEETADDNADGDDEDARTENQDDEEEEPEESDSEPEDEEEQAETPQHEEQCEASEQMLPVWRPYYQIQKRDDGVYIVANLRGVDPRYVQVHAMPQQGVLRIFGVKYPTQKDILLSRLSGAPTFGRFEIVERFPTQMINLENASQQLREDGTLQVRLPFYLVQHPRIMRRVSPFQPHRLVVW